MKDLEEETKDDDGAPVILEDLDLDSINDKEWRAYSKILKKSFQSSQKDVVPTQANSQ